MKTALYTATFLFILFSVVFAEATFNSTNEQTMARSIEMMMEDLSSEDQVKLQQSIAAMYVAEGIAQMGKADSMKIQKIVGKKLHGKNAKEIIKLATDVRIKLGGMSN